MNQRILANLGFLLQTAGLLTLLPIAVGFIFNETPRFDTTLYHLHNISGLRILLH